MPRAGRWTVYVRNVAAVLLYGLGLVAVMGCGGAIGECVGDQFFVMIHAALLICRKRDCDMAVTRRSAATRRSAVTRRLA